MNEDAAIDRTAEGSGSKPEDKYARRGRLVLRWFAFALGLTHLWLAGVVAYSYFTLPSAGSELHAAAAPDQLRAGQAAFDSAHFEVAWAVLRPLAAAGDPQAQYLVGRMHQAGDLIGKDRCEATRWFDRAARQGHLSAAAELAAAYRNGDGVGRDHARAYRWALYARTEWDWSRQRIDRFEDYGAALDADARTAIENGMTSWRPQQEAPAWIIPIPDFPLVGSFGHLYFRVRPCRDRFLYIVPE